MRFLPALFCLNHARGRNPLKFVGTLHGFRSGFYCEEKIDLGFALL